jgi:KDO2-lipid IV(A) lauroyltransferase
MATTAPPKLGWTSLHPRNWGAWSIIGFLFFLSLLPSRLSWFLGRWMGRLAVPLLKSRRHIATRNLELCFPELSAAKRQELLKQNFERLGLALVDTATSWFWPQWRFNKHMRVEGWENVEALRRAQPAPGILVLSMHFYNLEWVGRMYGSLEPGVGVYRPNRNPVYEHFQHKARIRCNRYLIDRRDVRGMVKALRDGICLWYLPDHDYGRRGTVFAPLFGVENVATVTGTSTLAKVKNTRVQIIYAKRDLKKRQHTLVVQPISESYPSGDELADATFINQEIEAIIRRQPEEYMWIHRRFKTRPEGVSSRY